MVTGKTMWTVVAALVVSHNWSLWVSHKIWIDVLDMLFAVEGHIASVGYDILALSPLSRHYVKLERLTQRSSPPI